MNPARTPSNAPGAQAVAGVQVTATVVSRAPGFPIYCRLAAIVARYERRGFPLFSFDRPPLRYRRLRVALTAAWSAPWPARHTRLMGSSLRQELAADRRYHDRILEALGYHYCPGACALCDERAQINADDFYERESKRIAGAM
jgi:hypothetical protein